MKGKEGDRRRGREENRKGTGGEEGKERMKETEERGKERIIKRKNKCV